MCMTVWDRMRIPPSHSVVSPTTNLKAKDSPFSIPKQHIPIKESPHSQFGLISSDSQLNPSQITTSRNYNPVLDFNAHESHDQKPLRPFMDEWPKDQSSSATIAWPEELKSDWTQLSMSIPLASDFSSTSSSSPQDTIAQSPLRLSRELSQMENCMSLTNHHSESNQKQKNWIPISWGSSVGGPLGEVLNSTSSTVGGCKNSSASNLTRSGVWNGSPQLGSSPTGVLQKTNFVSLSNSSSGGSPRAENKTFNGSGSIGDDVLGSTLSCSFSLPSLWSSEQVGRAEVDWRRRWSLKRYQEPQISFCCLYLSLVKCIFWGTGLCSLWNAVSSAVFISVSVWSYIWYFLLFPWPFEQYRLIRIDIQTDTDICVRFCAHGFRRIIKSLIVTKKHG